MLAVQLRPDVVTQVESFSEVLDVGRAGDNVGCLLRKTGRDEVKRGQGKRRDKPAWNWE